MKEKQFLVYLSLVFFIMAISACTTQAWYDGMKEGAKNNCRSQPPSEVERCLEDLNKKSYEAYEKERSTQK